jgi:hypothetical protein
LHRLDRNRIAWIARRCVQDAAFSNIAGTGALLDRQLWSFVNGDISLNLLREPAGEWILLDAVRWIDANGSGFSFARMADAYGFFARSSQSFIIEKR